MLKLQRGLLVWENSLSKEERLQDVHGLELYEFQLSVRESKLMEKSQIKVLKICLRTYQFYRYVLHSDFVLCFK